LLTGLGRSCLIAARPASNSAALSALIRQRGTPSVLVDMFTARSSPDFIQASTLPRAARVRTIPDTRLSGFSERASWLVA